MLLLGMCLFFPSGVEHLLLGWIYFPLRVAPRMTADWPTVAVGLICTVAFCTGLHRTLRWLAGHDARQVTAAAPGIGLRTTLALAIVIFLLFASGTAMVGATHQVVWVISGRTAPSARRTAAPPVHGLITDVRTAARRSQQRNNLKQIGLSVHNFHDSYGALPPGGTIDDHGRLMHGWAIYLANYAMYSSAGVDFSRPWNEPPNDSIFRCALPEFINPAIAEVFDKDGYGLSHVAGNFRVLPIARISATEHSSARFDAVLAARSRDDAGHRNLPLQMTDIRDGLSNTVLIGEAAGNHRPWGHPANVRDPALGVGRTPEGFGGPPGAGGAQFLMLDGSVRFISDQVDANVLRALATPAGGDDVDAQSAERAAPGS